MGKRAGLYARVSTDEQAEKGYSLPTQLSAMREYAASKAFEVIAEFADDCSGTVPIRERPEGMKVYDLVERGLLDVVVLFTHDRTARDELVIEYLLFKSYLYERGVELHYTDTGLDPYTMEGNLVGYIKSHAAADERKKIRERSVRGRNAKAQSNHVVMTGSPPFGICRDGALWVLDEVDIDTVKTLFDWFHNGDGKRPNVPLRAIAIKLEELHVPPPHNRSNAAKHWIPTTIRGILSNEIYTGRTYYGKTRIIDGKRVKQPREKWIAIDVPELAVIDRQMFDEVQERLRANRVYARRNAKHQYLLSGFSRCGACGGAMGGDMARTSHKGKVYTYPKYRCGNHWHVPDKEPCPNRNRHTLVRDADKAVWEWITKLLTDEQALDEGLTEMAKRNEDQTEPYRQRLEEIDKVLNFTKRRIDRLVKALSNTDDDEVAEAIEAELRTLKKQRDGLKTERRGVEARLAKVQVTPDLKERIKKQARDIRSRLLKPNYAHQRQLFRDINLQVIFHVEDNHKRRLEVSCELHPESEPIMLQPS